MNWTDRQGNPVFRTSPDTAWPLRRESDRRGEASETRSGSTEGESAVAQPFAKNILPFGKRAS